MLSTLVHIKDKYELKIIVPFVFSFQLKLGFIEQKRFFEQLESIDMGDVGTVVCSLPVVGVCRGGWSMQHPAAPILFTEHCNTISLTHYPSNITKPSLPYFKSGDFDIISSHLALRTLSVFLILTKINLLFSRWILCACKCCDSHIQQM